MKTKFITGDFARHETHGLGKIIAWNVSLCGDQGSKVYFRPAGQGSAMVIESESLELVESVMPIEGDNI